MWYLWVQWSWQDVRVLPLLTVSWGRSDQNIVRTQYNSSVSFSKWKSPKTGAVFYKHDVITLVKDGIAKILILEIRMELKLPIKFLRLFFFTGQQFEYRRYLDQRYQCAVLAKMWILEDYIPLSLFYSSRWFSKLETFLATWISMTMLCLAPRVTAALSSFNSCANNLMLKFVLSPVDLRYMQHIMHPNLVILFQAQHNNKEIIFRIYR